MLAYYSGTFAFKQNKNLPPGEQLVIHTPGIIRGLFQENYFSEKEGCPIMEEYACKFCHVDKLFHNYVCSRSEHDHMVPVHLE
jgi:hypothetical protein